MSQESVDKQINAKDQGVVQAPVETTVKPWNVNYQPKTPDLVTVGGYVEAKKQEDGTYQATLHIDVGDQKRSTPISNESAVAIAKAAGTQEIKTTDGGMIVPLNSNAVAEIAEREFNLDLKAVNIDKNSHKDGGAVNVESETKKYTVNALAAPTVTDWESSDPTKRKEGKIVTGPKADVKVKANDTGKGGIGTKNDKGASTEGTGEGANSTSAGSGLGDGTGNGYGVGDGSGDSVESSSNSKVSQSTQHIEAGTTLDDAAAAASYAYNQHNGAINHIFHNSHYQDDPVPAWSFSVDFVPLCMSDKRFTNLYTFEDSKTLTKAVLNITANEKTINTQSINYLGLQHPFFTKLAQSHGDLKITFAEDEMFSISTILKNVLKYASYLPNFPTNKVYELKKGDWEDEIVAYAASDDISPKYRLNATNLKITDQNTASLVHDFKFVFDILLKIYKAENAHIFADEAAPPGFVYHFHKCWLKNIAGIELNYDDDKPIDRPAVFSYQYMSGVPYYEWVSRNRTTATS